MYLLIKEFLGNKEIKPILGNKVYFHSQWLCSVHSIFIPYQCLSVVWLVWWYLDRSFNRVLEETMVLSIL